MVKIGSYDQYADEILRMYSKFLNVVPRHAGSLARVRTLWAPPLVGSQAQYIEHSPQGMPRCQQWQQARAICTRHALSSKMASPTAALTASPRSKPPPRPCEECRSLPHLSR